MSTHLDAWHFQSDVELRAAAALQVAGCLLDYWKFFDMFEPCFTFALLAHIDVWRRENLFTVDWFAQLCKIGARTALDVWT